MKHNFSPKIKCQAHQLKTWPSYFKRLLSEEKTFEVRKNDRDFQTGDYASLNEWDPEKENYTGNQLDIQITYVLSGGQFGIEKDYCVFGFKIIKP